MLAEKLYWEWTDASYAGYLCSEAKRPYGNSNIEKDIAEILKWPIPKNGLSTTQIKLARQLHKDLQYAIPILLQYGRIAGEYACFQNGNWYPCPGN
jgi:hypothetical protein